MNKIKKVVLPLMLGAFLFGGVSNVVNYDVPEVHAADALTGGIGNMPSFSMNDGVLDMGNLENADKDNFFNTVLTEYQGIITFIAGIGTVSMVLFFILNFINLGKSQGNPQERQKAISGLIISGIASAGLGSVTMIVALFFNAL